MKHRTMTLDGMLTILNAKTVDHKKERNRDNYID